MMAVVTEPDERTTVSGEGPPRPHPLLGFHGPGSPLWKVNREAVLLGAGPAALLLQIAHPHVAEGVAQHSAFEADPWSRLRRTLRTTLAIVFGDGPTAEAAIRRLNGVHATVRGDAADPLARTLAGETYRALDPELLLWVQVTLVWSSVRAYETWVGPLTGGERETLWSEAREVGRRLGIPLTVSPPDWPAVEAYWARMLAPDGPIVVTPTAQRLAATIIRPPILGLPPVIIDILATPGLALLPPRLRSDYGIAWSRPRSLLARLGVVGLRAWVRLMPRAWRALPQARAAETRVGRAGVASVQSQPSPPSPDQEPTARA
jgi:uncharacterized protein (DUF2236 family)